MLQRLTGGEMSVMELAAPFKISKPAITKHLKVLEKAGLLRRQIIGRIHHCYLVPEPLSEAAKWIIFYEGFWNKKFDALDKYLDETSKKKGKKRG
jgi:DNA-binding transcriptional ArsR family regulator